MENVEKKFKIKKECVVLTWTDFEGDKIVIEAADPLLARDEWQAAHSMTAELGHTTLKVMVQDARKLMPAPQADPREELKKTDEAIGTSDAANEEERE